MTFTQKIYQQFYLPEGLLGSIAGWIMSKRSSNIKRNLWTIKLLDLKPTDTVLEIGHGPGVAIQEASKYITDGLIIGIDHSPLMNLQAKERNMELINSNHVELRIADIEARPISGEKFSKIFCTNVAQFWKQKPQTISYLHELLLEDGILAITYLPRHRGANNKDADDFGNLIKSQMVDAGFKQVKLQELIFNVGPKAICVLATK